MAGDLLQERDQTFGDRIFDHNRIGERGAPLHSLIDITEFSADLFRLFKRNRLGISKHWNCLKLFRYKMDPAVGTWFDAIQFEGKGTGHQVEISRFDETASSRIYDPEFSCQRQMEAIINFSGKPLKSRPGSDIVCLTAFDHLHVQFREELIPGEIVIAFFRTVFYHERPPCCLQ